MNVAAATRQLLVGLGHEAGHDAKACAYFLDAGLEQNGPVGLLQRFAESDGDLVNTGAGFGVQAFDGDAKGQHLVHDGLEEVAVLVHAQQRVAEHARCQLHRPHALFGGPAVRRFQEIEPLEFHAGHDLEAHFLGAPQHALERMGRCIGVDELAEEKGHALVPGHMAEGSQVQPCQRIGKAVLPARHRGVVVAAVGHVPAQHHVAKAKAAGRVGFGGAQEFVLVQDLAAQHAVDVADGHLDLGRARFFDRLQCGVGFAGCFAGHAGLLAIFSIAQCAGAAELMPMSCKVSATA